MILTSPVNVCASIAVMRLADKSSLVSDWNSENDPGPIDEIAHEDNINMLMLAYTLPVKLLLPSEPRVF